MIGPSYLGLVQWAVAPDAGDDLAALAIQVSASQFHGQTYAGGSLSLEIGGLLAGAGGRPGAPVRAAGDGSATLRRLAPRCCRVAARRARRAGDRRRGAVVPRGRSRARPGRTPTGSARDFAAGVAKVTAPVQLVGGWYDIFLPWMLEDFRALRPPATSRS